MELYQKRSWLKIAPFKTLVSSYSKVEKSHLWYKRLGFLWSIIKEHIHLSRENVSLIKNRFFFQTFLPDKFRSKRKYNFFTLHKMKHQSLSLSVFADMYFHERHTVIFDKRPFTKNQQPLRDAQSEELWNIPYTVIYRARADATS